jgi:hypothetical protein
MGTDLDDFGSSFVVLIVIVGGCCCCLSGAGLLDLLCLCILASGHVAQFVLGRQVVGHDGVSDQVCSIISRLHHVLCSTWSHS